jgi:hypothetical protein
MFIDQAILTTALQRSAMFRSIISANPKTCDSYGAGRFIQVEIYRHLVPTGLWRFGRTVLALLVCLLTTTLANAQIGGPARKASANNNSARAKTKAPASVSSVLKRKASQWTSPLPLLRTSTENRMAW